MLPWPRSHSNWCLVCLPETPGAVDRRDQEPGACLGDSGGALNEPDGKEELASLSHEAGQSPQRPGVPPAPLCRPMSLQSAGPVGGSLWVAQESCPLARKPRLLPGHAAWGTAQVPCPLW